MNVTLTLRRRILALISLALLASIAAGLVLSYWHANKKVGVEMTAALASARSYAVDAVEPLVKAPEPSRQLQRIVASFNGNRHLLAAWIGPTGKTLAESELAQSDDAAPEWFYAVFAGKQLQADIPLPERMADLGFIRLSTDSHNEVGEVWEDISLKMLIVIAFIALVLGLVSFGLSHALRPLTNLSSALSRVGDGDYTARVPIDGPQEFARIYASFNAMSERLHSVESQNSRLNEQLAKVQEEERADIARDLHDEFAPFLFSIDVDARSIQNKTRTDEPAAIGTAADSIRASVAHLQKHLRSILGRLRPSALLDLGLKHALDHLIEFWRVRQPQVTVSLAVSRTSFGEAMDYVCYRVVQEALNNAMKHGGPDRIDIDIDCEKSNIRVTIADNGKGKTDMPNHGFGLSGMRERVRDAGGTLHCGNRVGSPGFVIHVELPAQSPSGQTRSSLDSSANQARQ